MMKMRVSSTKSVYSCTASAPNKIIIAGEHSVVYGGKALVAPVEIDGARNKVTARFEPSERGVVFKGDLGTARFSHGAFLGEEAYFPYVKAICDAVDKFGYSGEMGGVHAALEFSGAPKGAGNSASIAAACISATFGLLGKDLSKDELFSLVMPVEDAFHGGKASGADPRAVCSDRLIEFSKIFDQAGTAAYDYTEQAAALPSACALVLVDSYLRGSRSGTGDLVDKFARKNGVSRHPSQLTAEERRRVTEHYDRLVGRIEAEFRPNGDPFLLGSLFDDNHKMLKDGGVSSESIEQAISICKEAGAIGAKLSGAGGNGGAVLALCDKADAKSIRRAITAAGMKAYYMKFSTRGAMVEKTA